MRKSTIIKFLIGLIAVLVIFIVYKSLWTPIEPKMEDQTPVENLTVEKVNRIGDKSLETIIRTDERYRGDPLFYGPRGWGYWNYLESPSPIQNPNLWPDRRSTYFLARLKMPAGSSLTFKNEFPHVRYMKYALYRWEHNTFVSIGEDLAASEIEPEEGSVNPFKIGSDRLAEKRNYSLTIKALDPPADPSLREINTLYAGNDGGELELIFRLYLSDQGYDGAGWGPDSIPSRERGLPSYEGLLADGTKLNASEVAEQFALPSEAALKQPVTDKQWIAIVNAKDNDPSLDPETSPARPEPKWEKFWTLKYTVFGAFKTPEDRAKIPYQAAMEGGGDPATQYMITMLSRKYGSIYVMRGKMPTFPDTYTEATGKGLEVMPDAQTQYWSLVSCEAAPSSQIVDGLCDMQIPLDEDRMYTIVVSRKEDRPKNATLENGIAWLEWSARGEGLDDVANRKDFGMLILRIMANNPSWEERPDNILKPGTEEEVMGPYYPIGEYTDKATFEASGINQ